MSDPCGLLKRQQVFIERIIVWQCLLQRFEPPLRAPLDEVLIDVTGALCRNSARRCAMLSVLFVINDYSVTLLRYSDESLQIK